MAIINKILWIIAISFIIVNSVYFSIKLKFPQLKFNKLLKSIKFQKSKNEITPSDTLIMTLSSKIGVGSLAGTALCIYYGGPGAVFWMFLSSFLLSILNYLENALSIIYKDQKKNKSGPPYYIKKGLNKKKLAYIYALLVIIAYIFLFLSIQTNTIVVLTNEMISINKVLISAFITLLSGLIILKGIKKISNICNKLFPIMMFIFLISGIIIMCKSFDTIPIVIKSIINNITNVKSIHGGVIYLIIISFQRSIFATESGVGTSAIISGSSSSNNYKLQASLGLFTTYFINFVIIGITSLVILTSGISDMKITNGIELTKSAYLYHLGIPGEIILYIILVLFSFSTIITIYYYGESSLKFITTKKQFINILKIITIISIFTGGIINGITIWEYIDIFLAILTIINMYAIYKLRNIIVSKLE